MLDVADNRRSWFVITSSRWRCWDFKRVIFLFLPL